ncbi:hypothetical protein SAMN02745166_01072 [Prosthecobacter debontii]|uniref:Uncharacterized protein n=1 Tax=Prosthecobacter debontii TaxID=48467 RepID=A0A1T4X719_9BACT|nr:hypothetical protein [Prosthecobacter debontii]SKA84908.1 hypothetical protein SAMN02745166_01072 [Prosthecobacter debontii]
MKLHPYPLLNAATETPPAGEGSPMTAAQMAGFGGGDSSSPTVESPAPSAPAAVSDSPSTPNSFEAFLSGLGQPAPTPATEAQADPAQSAKPSEQSPPSFDFDKWYNDKCPENPDGTKIAKLEDWKSIRATLGAAMKDVQALTAEKLMLEHKLAQQPAKTPGMPQTDAVKRLQAELEANRAATESLKQQHASELAEFTAFKASQELASNPAFRAEYDGRRASILDEMKGVAKEAGLEEKVVTAVLEAKSLLQIATALEGVENPTVKALLTEGAKSFMDLTAKREAALKGDPLAELNKWKDYSQAQQGVMAARFTDALKSQLVAAVPAVAETLMGEKGNVYFRTPAGQAVMQQIGKRFEAGYDLTAQEVTEHMAKSAGFDFYANLCQDLMSKVTGLEQQLARYGSLEPNQGGRAPGGGGGAASGFDLAGMFGTIGIGRS